MKFHFISFISFFLLNTILVNAQDLIYKKDKDVLVVKIIEIGLDEIKYKEYTNIEGITLVIDKAEVLKIKFENGKTQLFGDYGLDAYANNRKNAVKLDFLSPMFGKLTMGYERSIKPGASMEFQLGIIGVGINNYKLEGGTATGFFFRAGYKFINLPDFYIRGMRYAHVLKGFYIRPELTLGYCVERIHGNNYYNAYPIAQNRRSGTIVTEPIFGSLMINFGKQWVFNELVLLDLYLGFGYGFKSKNEGLISQYKEFNIYYANSHAFLGPTDEIPATFGGGLKFGVLIK